MSSYVTVTGSVFAALVLIFAVAWFGDDRQGSAGDTSGKDHTGQKPAAIKLGAPLPELVDGGKSWEEGVTGSGKDDNGSPDPQMANIGPIMTPEMHESIRSHGGDPVQIGPSLDADSPTGVNYSKSPAGNLGERLDPNDPLAGYSPTEVPIDIGPKITVEEYLAARREGSGEVVNLGPKINADELSETAHAE